MNAQRPAGHALEERETKHQQANSDVRGIRPSLPENWRHADLPLPIRISASASAILHQIRLGSNRSWSRLFPGLKVKIWGTHLGGRFRGGPPTRRNSCKKLQTHPSIFNLPQPAGRL